MENYSLFALKPDKKSTIITEINKYFANYLQLKATINPYTSPFILGCEYIHCLGKNVFINAY